MKKLLGIILIAILTSTVVCAQQSKTLQPTAFGYSYTAVAGDTISATDTAWTYDVTVNKATPLYYNFAVKVLKVSAGSCTVYVMGKIYPTDEFTPISSGTFAGSQADTTILFTQNTTRQFYRIYRVKVVYVSGKTKVSTITNYLFY